MAGSRWNAFESGGSIDFGVMRLEIQKDQGATFCQGDFGEGSDWLYP